MSNAGNLLFVGLPGSGKTTFLAALWHVLEDRTGATTLRLKELSVDREYLNRITADWRACSQVQRTKLEPEELVVLRLEDEAGTMFEIAVPDLSGEAFEQQLIERKMSVTHDDLVQQATGVVLFVHPHVKEGTQLTYSRQLQAAIDGEPHGSGSSDSGAKGIEPWSVEKLPTQAALVELLQFILERAANKVRIAVVLSAWDLVESKASLAPQDYLKREMPLLRQYLDANDDLLEHVVFGVSAQGGDITVAQEKEALLGLDDALKRIRVRYGDDSSQDITRPIAWLLDEG